MRRLAPVLLLAAGLPATAAAQPSPVPPALRGVPYSVPPGFTAAPALGDSATAVFMQRRVAVAVAALPAGTERPAVIQHVRDVLARAASRRDPDTFRWRSLASSPSSPLDVYHERWIGYDGRSGVLAGFHALRRDGGDVLVATAFPLGEEHPVEAMFRQGFAPVTSFPAGNASARLVADLVGDPPFAEMEFVGIGTEGTPPPAEEPPRPDEPAVRAAFEAYRAALLSRDGEAALPHVSEAVFEYYGYVQRLALYAPADEVRARPLNDQMFVLLVRHRIDPEHLRGMTPREVFAYAVTQGWISEESTRTLQLGRVHVDGNMAYAMIGDDGRLNFDFVRQGGAWKWDMLSLIQWMDPALRMLAARGGLTPEELLMRTVQAVGKGDVPPTLWDPPFAAPDGR